MKKILSKLLVVVFGLILPVAAGAQLSSADTGLTGTVKEGYGRTESIIGLPEFVGTYVIRPILGLTGTLLFVLMTYAGFLWVTAQGDDKKIKKAKDILTECIVGTVILVGAYALANFVITALTATTTSAG